MRIRLKKEKQMMLILKAKQNLSWKDLATKLKINQHYLSTELKNEKRLLSENLYFNLKSMVKEDFDKFIIQKLPNNWGRAKGGQNSYGSTIKITSPKKSEKLAEIIGAILGDGNITFYKKGKKIGVYQIKIAGNINLDRDYHIRHLKNIFTELFGIEGKEIKIPNKNERFLYLSSREIVEFFIKVGLNPGNKIKNQSTIPNWVFKNNKYLKNCIRGLIDTDGCIHKMSNKNPNLLRIAWLPESIRRLSGQETPWLFLLPPLYKQFLKIFLKILSIMEILLQQCRAPHILRRQL